MPVCRTDSRPIESGFHGRVVQASSMVVYGEGRYRCPEHGDVAPGRRRTEDLLSGRFEPPCPVCGRPITPMSVTETAPLDPRNVYAATKAHQEHLGTAFAGATGSDVVSLRYHNVYGPRMPRDTPYAGVASIFRSSCEAHRPPQVFEDGQQRRDFIHVADVANANMLALNASPSIGGAYNVATGNVCTIGELAEYVCDGVDPTAPRPVITAQYRAGDVRHINASPALAQQTFGFTARVDHQVGLPAFATAPLRESLIPQAGS
jgi:dTDP-L-rhamnose 4-epimerase